MTARGRSLAGRISRAVLGGVATTAVAAALIPASAVGLGNIINYDCGGLDPNAWCQYANYHSYDRTAGSWHGDHNIWICAKLIAYNTSPEYQYARTCFYGIVVQVYSNDFGRAPYPNNNTYMYSLVANGNNPDRHIIYGQGEY